MYLFKGILQSLFSRKIDKLFKFRIIFNMLLWTEVCIEYKDIAHEPQWTLTVGELVSHLGHTFVPW